MAKKSTGAALLAGIAIIVSGILLVMAERKAAAVGRRFVFGNWMHLGMGLC